MSNIKSLTLDKAIAAARRLPESSQKLLAHEIMEQVEALSSSQLSAVQCEIVKQRKNKTRKHVSREDMHKALRKFNPDL